MAIQQVTEPVILDETGLKIEQRLAEIKNVLQPTNACIDLDISLPTTGWTGNGPYTYTYNNAHITTGCKVKVNFLETESASGGILYLEYEKVVGGVQFTAKSVPTTPIPVRIHIMNADAESIMATTADEVSTNAVTGASNVEQALGIVNDNVAEVNDKVGNVPEGETVEGQITSLNSNIANMGKAEVLSGVSSAVGTVDSRYIAKVNDVATVFIVLTLTSAISGSTVILSGIPKSYLNYTQVRILNANTAEFLDGYIDNTGKLTLKGSAPSGNSLRFCLTYMVTA